MSFIIIHPHYNFSGLYGAFIILERHITMQRYIFKYLQYEISWPGIRPNFNRKDLSNAIPSLWGLGLRVLQGFSSWRYENTHVVDICNGCITRLGVDCPVFNVKRMVTTASLRVRRYWVRCTSLKLAQAPL